MRTHLHSAPGSTPHRRGRWLAGLAATTVALGGIATVPAFAASVTGISFSGGNGTAAVSGQFYAKTGATMTVTVTTSNDTKCVALSGAFAAQQVSANPKSLWTFNVSAGQGEGVQGVTAAASPEYNTNQGNGSTNCTGKSESNSATYRLDNTGPVVSGAIAPGPNLAGWNNTDATVSWTATDSGSGVASGPTPASSTETTNGVFTRQSSATDRVGNSSGGSITVRVDKVAPLITATQTSAGYGQPTTVTFTCGDDLSGIASCLADGSSSSSVTVTQNGTVTGTAIDMAGNKQTHAVEVENVDTTPPTLSGAPTTEPNAAGWYRDDVTVSWSAADPESGIPTQPADTTITGEGTGLVSTTSVKNGSGLATTATSSPAVKIDRTAPSTALIGNAGEWANDAVTLEWAVSDNLSGVASTAYRVDGGEEQSGSSMTIAEEGEHTITFFSTDHAGNVEESQTATVLIDRTAPTIGHRFLPTEYVDGAWANYDVRVVFECSDQGGSGLAACSDPVNVAAEGKAQRVEGAATDNADNTATDAALVSIDKTPPSITATLDRSPNKAGWFSDDVTVTFTSNDDLSGVASADTHMVVGEGAGQSVTGTVTDAAGNSAGASVDAINVDKTKPVLDGSFAGGWHTDDVTVEWTCTDALSGVAEVPAASLVTGQGGNLSATASCTDKAGNTVSATVDGIKIDRTAPVTLAKVAEAPAGGWYGAPVEVTLDGSDNLSGVASTFYTVDGGEEQTYEGPFAFDTEGTHTIAFWSVDGAGNAEEAGAPLTLKVDRTAPTTTVTSPIVPGSGWFVTSGISFSFEAQDGNDRSSVAAIYYTVDGVQYRYGEPFTEDLSTGTHRVTYWSVDLAGNVEPEQELVLNVDTDAPTITGTQTPAVNPHGWNNSDVTVTFTCDDVGSGVQTGIAGCAGDTILENEGTGQIVTGEAVDVAGNRTAKHYGPVNIDKTRPTLVPRLAASNAAGWYKGDVTVTWLGEDDRSGIDEDTRPEPTTITGEGADLGAGPVTVKDKAGNESEAAFASGIKIDRTAPVITGEPTTEPNAAGWYKDAVTIAYDCTDSLSGVAFCAGDDVLSENGAGQTVTSGPVEDRAGNPAVPVTVGNINIDGTSPSTLADNKCTKSNGWCTGEVAEVVLTATDQTGLSGVEEIRYRIDGGEVQVAASAAVTVKVPLDGSGEGTVSYWAVDRAGNAEKPNAVALKWDNIAPTVTHTVDPKANADGWNNVDLTVTFAAKDNDKGSGVDEATLTEPVTVTEETDGLVVIGSAQDLAGNKGTDKVIVKLDTTEPVITGAVAAGKLGKNGWYVGPVTVSFECKDDLSGVAACPADVVLTDNGADQSVTRAVVDRAGNSAEATVSGIDIDQEKPLATDVNVQGGSYVLGSAPGATCIATDQLSGAESCVVTVTGGTTNGVGTFSWAAVATDKAGNVGDPVTGTYKVTYKFGGFLQPINDTAHQVGTSTSIFKAGSTVPVKFQLRNSSGALVLAASAPTWLAPVKGSKTSLAVDEAAYASSADSGIDYRYDAVDRQYIYNWKTPSTGGNYWRIGVTLDDGQTYYVNIGLR